MKRLSRWAKHNPVKSRVIIAFSHIIVMLSAFGLGALLFTLDWGYAQWPLAILTSVFSVAYILYPQKGRKSGLFRYSYARQKCHDFTLVVSYALLISVGFNNFLLLNDQGSDAGAGQPHLVVTKQGSIPPSYATPGEKLKNYNRLLHYGKKEASHLRKQLKSRFREFKKELRHQGKQRGTAENIFAILLILALVVFLGLLIGLLACNVACSGNEGLAWVILIVGWLGVITLGVFLIRRVVKGSKSG